MEVIRQVPLDWRRALGLFVWYYSAGGGPQAAAAAEAGRNLPGHLAQALAAFAQHLQAQQPVPLPTPPYAQARVRRVGAAPRNLTRPQPPPCTTPDEAAAPRWMRAGRARASITGHAPCASPSTPPQDSAVGPSISLLASLRQPVDVQHAVMQLWVQREGGDAAGLLLDPPAELLAASGCSANPCSAGLPWLLLTALQACGVLRPLRDADLAAAASGAEEERRRQHWPTVLHAHMALVGQLLLAGDMSEWALYVALHLPDVPPAAVGGYGGGCLRRLVVAELLSLTAPQWAGHAWREAFLTQVLGLPQVRLAS